MGKKALVPAARRDGEVPLLQRGRVGAGGVQGPRADVEEPAPADRGDRRSRRSSAGAGCGVHLHPRRVLGDGRRARPRRRRGLRGRATSGENILDSGRRVELVVHRGRRRLHLRRGDRAARRARGQARQPAAEAAVPRDPGPLRRADADQQRRDAVQRPAHRRQRRRLVQELRDRAVARDEGRVGLGLRAAPRQLRGRAGHAVAGAHLRPRRRPVRGPRGEGLVPGRLLRARC